MFTISINVPVYDRVKIVYFTWSFILRSMFLKSTSREQIISEQLDMECQWMKSIQFVETSKTATNVWKTSTRGGQRDFFHTIPVILSFKWNSINWKSCDEFVCSRTLLGRWDRLQVQIDFKQKWRKNDRLHRSKWKLQKKYLRMR